MKPDWKDAPEWAKWLAMDSDGAWWWYEKEPRWSLARKEWEESSARGRLMMIDTAYLAEDSKEVRP